MDVLAFIVVCFAFDGTKTLERSISGSSRDARILGAVAIYIFFKVLLLGFHGVICL
jgi:hypothetical protein